MALAQGPALAGAPRDISAGPRTAPCEDPAGLGLSAGTAHGSVSGVRLAHFDFGAPQCAGRSES